jgi:hypothetical protein
MGEILNKPLHEIWGLDSNKSPYTSYTIGIDKPEIIKLKTENANQFKILGLIDKLVGKNLCIY